MINLTRYNWDSGHDIGGRGAGMHKCRNGRWVKFDDVKELLNTSTNNDTCNHDMHWRQQKICAKCGYVSISQPVEKPKCGTDAQKQD